MEKIVIYVKEGINGGFDSSNLWKNNYPQQTWDMGFFKPPKRYEENYTLLNTGQEKIWRKVFPRGHPLTHNLMRGKVITHRTR